jgi:2-keto-4-pentenoate hydratase/2-oxohepta-3-ene-1,7-dioic acid hydratase in catechol pathway
VVVIGKRARDVPADKALEYVFGVTAGNDVSERGWQGGDLQWWRAKAAHGFAPIGPYIATGLNVDDLLVQTRLNGRTVQSERTTHMLHDVAAIVSSISGYVTLEPGDAIFTGTPSSMQVGDKVEVEVEGVGVLSNPVASRRPD